LKFSPRHSRESGNPESSSRRNALPFFDFQPFWLERTYWIPAFAGMTMKLHLLGSKTLWKPNLFYPLTTTLFLPLRLAS
jgi:hypothetical protein